MIRAPWWLCCGWSWRSVWCVLDVVLHKVTDRNATDDSPADALPGPLRWICDRHDALITEPLREDVTR